MRKIQPVCYLIQMSDLKQGKSLEILTVEKCFECGPAISSQLLLLPAVSSLSVAHLGLIFLTGMFAHLLLDVQFIHLNLGRVSSKEYTVTLRRLCCFAESAWEDQHHAPVCLV